MFIDPSTILIFLSPFMGERNIALLTELRSLSGLGSINIAPLGG
jgi:hypothetical protein